MAAIGGLLLLSACSSRAEQAEKQYQMVKQLAGSGDDLCGRAKAVADAQLEAGNQWDYRVAKPRADSDCLQADMDRRDGIVRDRAGSIIEPDNMDEAP